MVQNMKNSLIVGIVCEYDPFHRGHEAHIRRTRELLGGDALTVCAMSGSYTQRGAFAMFPKWARAEWALSAADLAVELPLSGSLSSGELFAQRGVETLAALGCRYISFGSECGSTEPLEAIADCMERGEYTAALKEALRDGLSYARANQAVLNDLIGKDAELLLTPNNMLGVEYIRAIRRGGYSMTPVTVRRDRTEDSVTASEIRKKVLAGKDIRALVPPVTESGIKRLLSEGQAPALAENAERAFMLLLRSRTPAELARLPRCSEGLDRKLYEAFRYCQSVSEVAEAVKSKRYSRTRIDRLILCALLGLDRDYMAQSPAFIRLLGANSRGRAYLRSGKDRFTLPLITKAASVRQLSAEAVRQFEVLSRSTDLRNMALPGSQVLPAGSEWREKPVFVGEPV